MFVLSKISKRQCFVFDAGLEQFHSWCQQVCMCCQGQCKYLCKYLLGCILNIKTPAGLPMERNGETL